MESRLSKLFSTEFYIGFQIKVSGGNSMVSHSNQNQLRICRKNITQRTTRWLVSLKIPVGMIFLSKTAPRAIAFLFKDKLSVGVFRNRVTGHFLQLILWHVI